MWSRACEQQPAGEQGACPPPASASARLEHPINARRPPFLCRLRAGRWETGWSLVLCYLPQGAVGLMVPLPAKPVPGPTTNYGGASIAFLSGSIFCIYTHASTKGEKSTKQS